MSQFIVTLKLERNRNHDSRNKVTAPCPLSGHECTDPTGEHHSVVVDAQTSAGAHAWFTSRGIHVTRVEAFTPAITVPGPMITDIDTMVDAATAAVNAAGSNPPIHPSWLRVAIVAALKAGCNHLRMGDWWLCNFGADEVRICPDCDLVEKRKAVTS